MTEEFPSYFKWAFKQWSFWVIFSLYTIWVLFSDFLGSDFISYDFISYGLSETLGSLASTFFLTNLLFLFIYTLCRHTCKKLGYLK